MKKTKVKIGPSDTELLGKCISCIVPHCDEETKELLNKVLEYLIPRSHQPYCFMTYDEVYACWNVCKVCIDTKEITFTDEQTAQIGKVAYELAMILDNKEIVKWREFT